MKLVDLSITEFAKVLGSDAPAPGGGSAAALSAANGISLTKMVCELTIGKKKYAEFEDHIKAVHEKSAQLQDQLLEAIDKVKSLVVDDATLTQFFTLPLTWFWCIPCHPSTPLLSNNAPFHFEHPPIGLHWLESPPDWLDFPCYKSPEHDGCSFL